MPAHHLSEDLPEGLTRHPDVRRLREASPSRGADLVGQATHPQVVVPALLLLVAVQASGSALAGIGWALAAATVTVGLPMAWLALQVRRGRVLDAQVVVREQRHRLTLVAATIIVSGLVVLHLAGAPRPLLVLVLALLAGLLAMGLVSLAVKASFHVGVLAGAVVVVARTAGPVWALVILPLLALSAWARVRAGRHTVGQVALGLVVGAVTTALVHVTLLP